MTVDDRARRQDVWVNVLVLLQQLTAAVAVEVRAGVPSCGNPPIPKARR